MYSSSTTRADEHEIVACPLPTGLAHPAREESDPNEIEIDLEEEAVAVPDGSSGSPASTVSPLAKRAKTNDPAHSPRPVVALLGTGAAKPSLLRGLSCVYFQDGINSALLDVGEGSTTQLARLLGSREAATRAIASLRFVWISHHHLDHHGGLLHVLELRSTGDGCNAAPLLVFGPSSLGEFLQRRCPASSYRFAPCSALQSQSSHWARSELVGPGAFGSR